MEKPGITIVRHALSGHAHHAIPLRVDRWTLAKTRWRGKADDGREFGFELEHPLAHGDVIAAGYVIEQAPEPVLCIPVSDLRTAASLAWAIGNLHQPVQVHEGELVSVDDPALKNMLHAAGVGYKTEIRIFQPQKSSHGHHHTHD